MSLYHQIRHWHLPYEKESFPLSISSEILSLMSCTRTLLLTLLAMVAFAGNSLLCREALRHTTIDPASFTALRLLSGALALGLIVRLRDGSFSSAGSWQSALALFGYAAGFSFAYVNLPAATGALLLFGAVQATMIGYGLWRGAHLRPWQVVGLVAALGGLTGLVLPGLAAPPLSGAMLMVGAGIAWGIYSLRGRQTGDPTTVTAGNFLKSVPLAAALGLIFLPGNWPDVAGCWYAVASGALASGVGYAMWYTALRGLSATSAATVQLSVPVLAAAGGVIFLGEVVTMRLVISAVAILGGIALVMAARNP